MNSSRNRAAKKIQDKYRKRTLKRKMRNCRPGECTIRPIDRFEAMSIDRYPTPSIDERRSRSRMAAESRQRQREPVSPSNYISDFLGDMAEYGSPENLNKYGFGRYARPINVAAGDVFRREERRNRALRRRDEVEEDIPNIDMLLAHHHHHQLNQDQINQSLENRQRLLHNRLINSDIPEYRERSNRRDLRERQMSAMRRLPINNDIMGEIQTYLQDMPYNRDVDLRDRDFRTGNFHI